ncbi:MAG: TetR/AcrR family transcriptional regulator [Sneathiella sp.]|nr:TetR/AcrR family transcriptional regulator [Sneathiella sp.]
MTVKQKNERVEAILDVAEAHIRRGGFNAVSFRDIASEVGIKSSSVHYHFPYKHDLGKAVVERYAERFRDILGSPSDPRENPAQRIERLGQAYIHSLKVDGAICLGCVLGAETSGLPEEVKQAVVAFFNQMIEWTDKALDGAKGPASDAQYIIGALQGTMVLSVALGDQTSLAATVSRLSKSI